MHEERRRIVPLAQSAQRIALQMLAGEVHSVGELLLEHPQHAGEVEVPAAEREALGKNLLLPDLHRRRDQLGHGDRTGFRTAEVVHARNMVPAVLRHHRAVAVDLPLAGLFEHMVAGQHPAVLVAPLPDLLHEVPTEETGGETPETNPHRVAARHAEEEHRQLRQKFAVVGPPVLLLQHGRPEEAVSRELGLVSEDSLQAA